MCDLPLANVLSAVCKTLALGVTINASAVAYNRLLHLLQVWFSRLTVEGNNLPYTLYYYSFAVVSALR